MGREQLRDYVDARLPTIDRNNYMIIEEVKGGTDKIKGFDEDKYKEALEARDETIDKIIRERPINRQDLLWILPKRKIKRDDTVQDFKTKDELEQILPQEDIDYGELAEESRPSHRM
jgi:phage terminase small subunit